MTPFVLAGPTQNAKLIGIAVNCLQRLIVSKCLAVQTLKPVLDTLSEAATLGFDVQLRVLQALPSLFQNYGQDLHGPLLAKALAICSTLQGSKTVAVNSTAAATLQQLVVSVFDKVVAEDGTVPRGQSRFDTLIVPSQKPGAIQKQRRSFN